VSEISGGVAYFMAAAVGMSPFTVNRISPPKRLCITSLYGLSVIATTPTAGVSVESSNPPAALADAAFVTANVGGGT
jgi:hypothetical protein